MLTAQQLLVEEIINSLNYTYEDAEIYAEWLRHKTLCEYNRLLENKANNHE